MLTRIVKCKYRNWWYVLDSDGWGLISFPTPSQARKFRHLYKAYMTLPEDQIDAVMIKIKQLGNFE